MTIKRVSVTAVLTMLCLVLPALAKNNHTVTGPIVTTDSKHDTGPLLREIAPLLPEFNPPALHEVENPPNPNFEKWSQRPSQPDPVLQKPETVGSEATPAPGIEFDALGYGDSYYCNCMPADNDGAPGLTQYTEYVNTFYAVYDKSGNTLLGPLAGNSFWSGFGGGCQADDWGDPMIRFDRAAGRWIVAQFDLGPQGSGPYAECVAVSTTDDATGSYNRYRFTFAQFPDYPKLGVWPDAYYFSYNLNGSSSEVCANDRTNMLAGNTATQVCFTPSGQFGMLPADLDGATPPASGTPNYYVELDPNGSANLSMYAFHVDFTTPSDSSLTGPTLIPIAAYTPSCPGASRGACAPQPDPGSDKLETLSDRMMYRLVYRNFGDHTVLLASHTVQVNGTGAGLRWYEIHNPETGPTVYQSGTYSPDSQYRFMPAVAMDQNQDIAVGYTVSGSGTGQYPSLAYAGRVPSDTLGTLDNEVIMLAGTGSQKSGGYDRWGDYSSLTVDPSDDCTFWFSESYIKVTGQNSGFNWSTAIGNFVFPGCVGGGSPSFNLTASPNTVSVQQGGTATSTITVFPVNGFSGNVTMSASGLPNGVTAAFSPNPTSTSNTVTFTATSTATTGTSTVTITGTSGTITNTTTISLTVTSAASQNFTLTATPTSVSVAQGATGTSTITVVPSGGFTGNVTLTASPLPSGVSAGFVPNPTSTTSTLTFTASATAATGTTTVTVTGTSGSLTSTVPVSLTVTSSSSGAVSLSPTSLAWSGVVVGETSAPKTVTLTNTGTGALSISSISTTGDFVVATNTQRNACGATLAAGVSCTVKVTFTPTQVGARTGSLLFTDNAPGSPQSVGLSGTGTAQATLTPTTHAFPAETVGTRSPAFTFTLANKQNVELTGIALSTTGDFSISSTTCGTSLGASSSCTVSVVFTPSETGARTGTLEASDSALGSPQTSTLKGTGR